jgi:hypothetical protein
MGARPESTRRAGFARSVVAIVDLFARQARAGSRHGGDSGDRLRCRTPEKWHFLALFGTFSGVPNSRSLHVIVIYALCNPKVVPFFGTLRSGSVILRTAGRIGPTIVPSLRQIEFGILMQPMWLRGGLRLAD